jgi:hypothetical protein
MMLKKSTSFVLAIREAYLVKRRSFSGSFGRFTNDTDGLGGHPARRRIVIP